jgi:hypothetical protein
VDDARMNVHGDHVLRPQGRIVQRQHVVAAAPAAADVQLVAVAMERARARRGQS